MHIQLIIMFKSTLLKISIMQGQKKIHQDSFIVNNLLKIQYSKLPLLLHLNFNTAHSTSATRTNFLVKVSYMDKEDNCVGYGECGLPPKKPGIYMSNIEDCFACMDKLREIMATTVGMLFGPKIDEIRLEYLNFLDEIAKLSVEIELFGKLKEIISKYEEKQALFLLNTLNKMQQEHFRAPKSAIQFAILDYFSKKYHLDIFQLIYGPLSQNLILSIAKTYSFYTISLTQPTQMLTNTINHLKYTKYIKIKYNQNYKQLVQFLNQVTTYEEEHLKNDQYPIKFIIDANCSWTPASYRQFELLLEEVENKKISEKILFIEQPFDFQVSDYEGWKEIKKMTKMRILADQSFRNEGDMEKVQKVCHAINIKCEKAGGFFKTLKSALAAKQFCSKLNSQEIQIMFGSMVSTQLGCSQTYVLSPLAKYMDIDGSLLVKQPNISGGFSWNFKPGDDLQNSKVSGQILRDSKQHGIGIDTKILSNYF